jgi:hemerythrin superfamily protein
MSILKNLKKSMEEPGSAAGLSATQLLREDHKKVKGLFDEFESSEDGQAKRRIVEKAIVELTIHAKLEEELFYPTIRRETEEEELVDEAEEEHHVAKLLIGELAPLKSSGRFEAKFTVLAENVRHHIEEEEGEIFPKIEKSGFDLETLGQEMKERKMRLMQEVSIETIRDEASGIVAELPASGGGRSRRASRGSKSRRMGARGRARAKAAR